MRLGHRIGAGLLGHRIAAGFLVALAFACLCPRALAQRVTAAAFSPDRKVYALGDADKNVAVRDTETRKRLQTLQGHAGEISALAFSPDGKYLANGASSSSLWDVSTGERVHTLGGYSGAPNALAFADGGKTVFVGGWDNKFRVWDVSTGKEKTPPEGN
jgi:WD40 repeat protein